MRSQNLQGTTSNDPEVLKLSFLVAAAFTGSPPPDQISRAGSARADLLKPMNGKAAAAAAAG